MVDGDTVYEDEENRILVENTENGSTVVIRDAEESDAGEYGCKVSAVEIKHTVDILGMDVFDTKTDVYSFSPL